MGVRGFALVGLAVALAGCADQPLAPTGDDLTDPLKAFINPVILGHEHDDLSQHHIANNVTLIGRTLMGEDGPPGGPGEIDVWENLAYVALLGYGFGIVDLTDPTNPKTLSTVQVISPDVPITVPVLGPPFGRYAADIKVDRTGDWVFLALHASPTPGMLIYDARDKANPVLAGAWTDPSMSAIGCHMIEYGVVDGNEYVFCAPLDNAIRVGLLAPATPAPVRAVTHIGRIQLHNVESLQDAVGRGSNGIFWTLSGHDDMTLQPDPLTGKPTLYISAWNLGVRVVDFSIPLAPIEIGAWMGKDAEYYRGNIHTTMAYKTDDDRRIIVASPEGTDPPALFFVDATGLGNPKTVAQWRAVEDFGDEPGTFSMHNFQVIDQKVYIAMYHGGLWVFDVSVPETPTPIGSYMPSEPRADGGNYSVGAWDVVVWHGYMLTADGDGGFYVLHHEGDPAGDPKYTSFA